jgi:hypothetical protein
VLDTVQKKHILLHVAGESVSNIFYAANRDEQDAATFEEAVRVLSEHFQPMKDIDFCIFKFSQLKQSELESIDDFAVRLRREAEFCEFTNVDRELKRQILSGCRSTQLKEEVLKRPSCSLDELLKLARTADAARLQARAIESACKGTTKPEAIAAVQQQQHRRAPFRKGTARTSGQQVNKERVRPGVSASTRQDVPGDQSQMQ